MLTSPKGCAILQRKCAFTEAFDAAIEAGVASRLRVANSRTALICSREPKEATALFYATQVASTNMALLNANRNRTPKSGTKAVPSSDPKLLPP